MAASVVDKSKKVGTFNLPAFSLGNTEDKIMNIIMIPPIKSRKKSVGNQTLPVVRPTQKNNEPLVTIKRILTFTGFLVWVV